MGREPKNIRGAVKVIYKDKTCVKHNENKADAKKESCEDIENSKGTIKFTHKDEICVKRHADKIKAKSESSLKNIKKLLKHGQTFSIGKIIENLIGCLTAHEKVMCIDWFSNSVTKLRTILKDYRNGKKKLKSTYRIRVIKRRSELKKLRLEVVRNVYRNILDPMVQFIPRLLMDIPNLEEIRSDSFDIKKWKEGKKLSFSWPESALERIEDKSYMMMLRDELYDMGEYLRRFGENNEKFIGMAKYIIPD